MSSYYPHCLPCQTLHDVPNLHCPTRPFKPYRMNLP